MTTSVVKATQMAAMAAVRAAPVRRSDAFEGAMNMTSLRLRFAAVETWYAPTIAIGCGYPSGVNNISGRMSLEDPSHVLARFDPHVI